MSRKIYDVSGRKAALSVIPTQTNFIAKARKGINVFKKRTARERESERDFIAIFIITLHISHLKLSVQI